MRNSQLRASAFRFLITTNFKISPKVCTRENAKKRKFSRTYMQQWYWQRKIRKFLNSNKKNLEIANKTKNQVSQKSHFMFSSRRRLMEWQRYYTSEANDLQINSICLTIDLAWPWDTRSRNNFFFVFQRPCVVSQSRDLSRFNLT